MLDTASSLDPLFKPRSVAVIGASRKRGSVGAEIFHNIISNAFTGAVYPVNPGADVVQSVRAYRSVRDIPDPVDLAVIVVPKSLVLDVVDECAAKGVKALIVISAGFGETGPEGRALQADLLDKVRRNGMRMVGPNCLGLVTTDPEVSLNATFAPTWPPDGTVAFSSQSGALGLAILDHAKELGIGISSFVSVGNKADISGNDLIEYWGQDPRTKVILLYLESFGNPRRFMQIARRVSRGKPIVAVKSGRTEAGARAASSHTGSLAGLDVAVDALLAQAGVVRTNTIEELFDVAMLLENQPVPAGNRVAILTNAGGPGIMASDACESHGLQVAPLAPKTEEALREFLPPEASVRNPVDMIASAAASSYEKALRILLADEHVDAVIVLFVPPIVTEAAEVAAAIQRGAQHSSKPVVTCFMGTHGVPAAVHSLRAGRFPSYAFPESAAIALARAVEYGRMRARPEGGLPLLADVDRRAAEAIVRRPTPTGHKGRWLDADEVRALLAAYGVRTPETSFAATADEAAAQAERIGFPVALKLASKTITHKSDVGGVVLGLRSAEEVRRGFASISANVARHASPEAMDGVVVQQMVRGGVETFIGMTHDPAFGPLIGFGIGGTAVELWRDVVFRVHPITDFDAREMIDSIRGVKLLDGFRGAPPADRDALVEALLRISALINDLPEVRELDINPLLALAPGQGVVALDARLRVQPATAS